MSTTNHIRAMRLRDHLVALGFTAPEMMKEKEA